MANEDLYAFVRLDSWHTVAVGALAELSTLHSPWYGSGSLGAKDGSVVQQLLRAAVQGLPLLTTIAVFAVAGVKGFRLVATLHAGRRGRDAGGAASRGTGACGAAGVHCGPGVSGPHGLRRALRGLSPGRSPGP